MRQFKRLIRGKRKLSLFLVQNFHLFGNDLAIQYTVVTRIETRVNKTPGETFVSSVQFSSVAQSCLTLWDPVA